MGTLFSMSEFQRRSTEHKHIKHSSYKTALTKGGIEKIPPCPRINGKLDLPSLQIFKLQVLRANKAPPNNKPVAKVAAFLVKINPKSPPPKTNPPAHKLYTLELR